MQTGKPLEMGDLSEREVITSDGRVIGKLKGAWLDTANWSVSSLIIDLNKEVVDELNVKKPMLRTARINLPVNFVKNVSDVVQLNTDMTSLSTAVGTSSQ